METNLPALLGLQCFEVCLGIEFRAQMNDDVILNEEKKNLSPLKLLNCISGSFARPQKQQHFSAEMPPVTLTHTHTHSPSICSYDRILPLRSAAVQAGRRKVWSQGCQVSSNRRKEGRKGGRMSPFSLCRQKLFCTNVDK